MAYISKIIMPDNSSYDLSASKLKTAASIDGVNFDGTSSIVHYGTCSTAAGTAAKEVTLANFQLVTGALVFVRFTVTNSAAVGSLTLNVNKTGAKSIKYRNGNLGSTGYLAANRTYPFIYDGTYWQLVGDIDTTTSNATQQQFNGAIKAGTSALVAANIIVANTDGLYKHLKAGTAFDITQPILYLSAACGASATTTSVYYDINFTVTTTQQLTMTAYRPVYIRGTLNGKIFTPSSTTPLTQTEPTTVDHVQYMLLGYAYNSTAMRLWAHHPIFEYRGGKFRLHEENDMGTWAYWKYNASTDSVDLIFE